MQEERLNPLTAFYDEDTVKAHLGPYLHEQIDNVCVIPESERNSIPNNIPHTIAETFIFKANPDDVVRITSCFLVYSWRFYLYDVHMMPPIQYRELVYNYLAMRRVNAVNTGLRRLEQSLLLGTGQRVNLLTICRTRSPFMPTRIAGGWAAEPEHIPQREDRIQHTPQSNVAKSLEPKQDDRPEISVDELIAKMNSLLEEE